ncbi:Wall-associated receptor kinase 2 [Bienertia sinuspersici]
MITAKNTTKPDCQKTWQHNHPGNETEKQIGSFETWGSTFTISHTANKLTVIGCDDYALVDFSGGMSQGEVRPWPSAGCFALCRNLDEAIPGSCLGTGCCQVDIPIGLQMGSINLHTLNNRRSIDEELTRVQPCSYAVFAGSDSFRFNGKTDLTNISALKNRTMEQIPLVLNWAVKHNISCTQAKKNSTTYLCKNNTACIDTDAGGYNCRCLSGYEGNPYLEPGCTDVDECATGQNNSCSSSCTNTLGSYVCSCPQGYVGDGLKTGSGCIRQQRQITIILGNL